jgi:hypothetical protein
LSSFLFNNLFLKTLEGEQRVTNSERGTSLTSNPSRANRMNPQDQTGIREGGVNSWFSIDIN